MGNGAPMQGRPKLPSRKTLIRKLDAVFSILIKSRDNKRIGKCPFHYMSIMPIECCFHFITRAKHSVRWDKRNAIGSCLGCNCRYEHDQTFIDSVFDWYKGFYGEEVWDKLKSDSNIVAPKSRTDLMELLKTLREEANIGE